MSTLDLGRVGTCSIGAAKRLDPEKLLQLRSLTPLDDRRAIG